MQFSSLHLRFSLSLFQIFYVLSVPILQTTPAQACTASVKCNDIHCPLREKLQDKNNHPQSEKYRPPSPSDLDTGSSSRPPSPSSLRMESSVNPSAHTRDKEENSDEPVVRFHEVLNGELCTSSIRIPIFPTVETRRLELIKKELDEHSAKLQFQSKMNSYFNVLKKRLREEKLITNSILREVLSLLELNLVASTAQYLDAAHILDQQKNILIFDLERIGYELIPVNKDTQPLPAKFLVSSDKPKLSKTK